MNKQTKTTRPLPGHIVTAKDVIKECVRKCDPAMVRFAIRCCDRKYHKMLRAYAGRCWGMWVNGTLVASK